MILSPPHRPTRRQIVASGFAASFMAACSLPKDAEISDARSRDVAEPIRQTYVLIHGAWHGGWCWRDVRQILEAAGHRVITPTLAGVGERAHLLSADIGLSTHIEDALGAIAGANANEIILLGHSYGGMVVTGVADKLGDQIKHIIYLDAAVPEHGQSMISQGTDGDREALDKAEASLRQLAPDGIGMLPLPPDLFGIPKDHASYDWVAKQLTPHPLKTWTDTISLQNGGSEGLARTYVHCTNPVLPETSFPYHAARAQADPSWNYHALPTGHDAMITAPLDVVAILEQVL